MGQDDDTERPCGVPIEIIIIELPWAPTRVTPYPTDRMAGYFLYRTITLIHDDCSVASSWCVVHSKSLVLE